MKSKEILEFCLQKGLLLDKEILNLFSETENVESVKLIIEKIRGYTQSRIITRNLFNENREKVCKVFSTLPEERQKELETLRIKLGLSIEISKGGSKETADKESKMRILQTEVSKDHKVHVTSLTPVFKKKPEVEDFVKYFKNRLIEVRSYLEGHYNLNNLISIDKISEDRHGISLIGLVSDKRVTKNKNILLELEDLTGKIRVLVNQNRPELYKKTEDVCLDSVIGVTGSGNREILFANDIIFPDSTLLERKKSPYDEYVLFIGDIHFGSKLFLQKSFLKFIDYLNGKIPNTPEVNKIKYLFIVGDAIAGVGNYPDQEKDLIVKDIEEQFISFAELLKKIRKDITIIISPGNHDGVRLMEPQPLLNEKYAWPLYNLKNVILTGNPAYVNIGAKGNFSGFDVLTYHGASFHYYAATISNLINQQAVHKPELIMEYLLKHRHLAPTHSATQYFPFEQDNHLLRKIPDIFVSGHLHKSGIIYHNNILIISSSSWESLTPYMEKVGSQPDFCKVPMFNLKTREVKILDFE